MLNITMLRNPKAIVALAAAFGALGGAAASYAITMKMLNKKFAEISEREIEEAKEYYRRFYKADEFSTPEGAFKAIHGHDAVVTITDEVSELAPAVEALLEYAGDSSRYTGSGDPVKDVKLQVMLEKMRDMPDTELELLRQGLEPTVEDGEMVEVSRNVFTNAQVGVEDFDPETADRDPSQPYVIKIDEFMESRPGWTQEQLTYYEADDVLAKDDDELVDDVNNLVGNINLTKFGLGSEDPNVVFVRNEKWECDLEISRVKGSYSEIVAGYIEHSVSRKTPRFRGDDD